MTDLFPFPGSSSPTSVQAGISWWKGGIEFHFSFPASSLLLDAPSGPKKRLDGSQCTRKDGLWQTTCFEAFWGERGHPGYWELNLSAERSWNLYRFEAYRSPQPPTPSNDYQLKWIETGEGEIGCRLEPAPGQEREWEASLCMVARTKEGITYLSSNHAGAKPDFHLRASFTLLLKPS